MKHKLLILMLAVSLPVFAQQQIVGIKGGVNLADFYFEEIDNYSSDRTNIITGITYQRAINHRFFLTSDLLYFQTSSLPYLSYSSPMSSIPEYELKISYYYNYLSVPIKAGVTFGKNISGYFAIGIVPAYLINAKIKHRTVQYPIVEQKSNISDGISRFDFAGIYEIGANYKFNDKYILSLSISNQASFTTTKNEYEYFDDEIKHHGLQVALGLKYILK